MCIRADHPAETHACAWHVHRYLANCFNEHYDRFDPASDAELPPPAEVGAPVGVPFSYWRFLYARSAEFRYFSVGSMASLGLLGGVVDMRKSDAAFTDGGGPTMTGLAAVLAWKGGYFSKQLSWSNMMLVPMFWFKSLVFGRDVSRF